MKNLVIYLLLVTILVPVQAQVDEFSWAKRHGNRNYTSPAKDQIIPGPCTIYASVGLVEAMYKIYFNVFNVSSHIVDLSEEQVYSTCALANTTDPSFENALEFAKNTGIVDNTCVQTNPPTAFPGFSSNIINCDCPCNDNFKEKVKIPKYSRLTFSSMANMKQAIINNGPIAVYCRSDSLHKGSFHAYLIIGWKKIDGKTNWEVLDSWQSISTRQYFTPVDFYNISVKDPGYFQAYRVYAVDPSTGNKITSTTRSAINCTDADKDGYYYWGIGPKPSNCPPGFAQPDGDDSNCRLGPMDINGNCSLIKPFVNNLTIAAVGNPSGLCPDYDYTINASVCGADEYEMLVIGDATKYGSGSSGTCWIHTSDAFGRIEIRVRARNAAGWSAYKSRFYYRNSYCPSLLKSSSIGATDKDIQPIETKNELTVYPVPVKDILYIKPSESGLIKRLIFINQFGLQVKNINLSGKEGIIELNVSDLPSGYYFLRIISTDNIVDKKIFVNSD